MYNSFISQLIAKSGKDKISGVLALVVASIFIFYFVTNLLGSFFSGSYAWDDGAITLSYARSLAEHQVFALTPYSEIVEGSSSLLLVFLMALLHRIFQFDFYRFIIASQLVAFLFTCGTMVLVYMGLPDYLQSSAPPSANGPINP